MTLRHAVFPFRSAQRGIESAAQQVADKAGGRSHAEDDHAGSSGYPPGVADMIAAFAQHGSEAGQRRLYAEAEQADSHGECRSGRTPGTGNL